MLFTALFAAVAVVAAEVKVSDFGYDATDSTAFIRAALASGAKRVVLDRQTGPWYTLPLKMPSDIEFVLEPGVELVAKRGEYKGLRDFLLELPSCTNVTIRGGKGATLRMWKKDYQGPDYQHGEWRYALRIHKCKNVLVEGLTIIESGGDGIAVTGTDITIRNCVCDRNHRQGMSIFNVKNLLVENCVFSNTSGTAPQSGVDIEPDSAKERIENVVFRNCVAYGNAGNGFETALHQLKRASAPISITYENCRSWGNARGDATLNCRSDSDGGVGGAVRYVNCVLGPSIGRCCSFSNLPDAAVDVEMRGCVLYGNSGETARPAVTVSVGSPHQGVPDGLTFAALTAFPRPGTPWFSCIGAGAGKPPARVGGSVRVVEPDGSARDEVLDAAWISKNMPVFDGGRPLPARRALPDASAVVVSDVRPGELVALAPVGLVSPTRCVFFADKPGPCRFVMRQLPDRDFKVKRPVVVTAIADGSAAKPVKLPAPDTEPTELVFDAPARGFYGIGMRHWAAKLVIEKASVPIAVDLSAREKRMITIGGRPFAFAVPFDGEPSTFMISGGAGRYRADVRGPDGEAFESAVVEGRVFVAHGERGQKTGLRVARFESASEKGVSGFTVDLYGAPPYVFLSQEKTWEIK